MWLGAISITALCPRVIGCFLEFHEHIHLEGEKETAIWVSLHGPGQSCRKHMKKHGILCQWNRKIFGLLFNFITSVPLPVSPQHDQTIAPKAQFGNLENTPLKGDCEGQCYGECYCYWTSGSCARVNSNSSAFLTRRSSKYWMELKVKHIHKYMHSPRERESGDEPMHHLLLRGWPWGEEEEEGRGRRWRKRRRRKGSRLSLLLLKLAST